MTIDSGLEHEFRIARSAHSQDLMTVVHAVPTAVPAVRQRVRQWLGTLAWPTADAEDVELAVSEAITNVVEHAYPPGAPGTAVVHAWVSVDPRTRDRRIVATVTDRGRWGAQHTDSPAPDARGHGLAVMSGVMAELHIQRAAAGTTVIMISAVVRRTTEQPALSGAELCAAAASKPDALDPGAPSS